MKVTFILPGYPWHPSGGYKVVYQYASLLAKRGHSVAVIHPYEIQPYVPPPPKHLRVLKQPLRSLLKWQRRRSLPAIHWQAIDPRVTMIYLKGEPLAGWIPDGDAVIATAWETAPYVYEYPESKGAKFHYVADYERWLTAEAAEKEAMSAAFQLPLVKLAISKAAAAMLGECMKSARQEVPLYLVPNAIDHAIYRCYTPIEHRSPYLIGMPYRTAVHKGMEDGFAALRSVKREHPQLRVKLFGGVPLKHRLEPWMEYAYRPTDEEVAAIYNGIGIFLVPSRAEGWGLPGMEAMACGAALCSTDTGGVREYASDGEDALISPPGDSAALAANLKQLIEHDRLRLCVARAGVSSVKRYTWDSSVAAFEQALRRHLTGQHESCRMLA